MKQILMKSFPSYAQIPVSPTFVLPACTSLVTAFSLSLHLISSCLASFRFFSVVSVKYPVYPDKSLIEGRLSGGYGVFTDEIRYVFSSGSLLLVGDTVSEEGEVAFARVARKDAAE